MASCCGTSSAVLAVANASAINLRNEKQNEEQNAEQVAITTPATTTLVKEQEEENSVEENSVEDLKQALVDSLYGTDRGLRASSETRGEIVELITQLEAKSPTAAPTEALALLDGKWVLAYTSFSELFPLLAAANLPLIKVGEISQTFDASSFTVQNSVKFEEGIIGTLQLTDSLDIPDNVEFLGQKEGSHLLES
ncbi:hypothetical protein R1sor_005853 [Riccia sorocarpa]|uniref:Plastid lipid-associated protein/fibrillin conserved domain-containing protein n=1 Tax=Riccia sorocarpa TaxID=122646 RepID=A0ABD3HPA1_9MARC